MEKNIRYIRIRNRIDWGLSYEVLISGICRMDNNFYINRKSLIEKQRILELEKLELEKLEELYKVLDHPGSMKSITCNNIAIKKLEILNIEIDIECLIKTYLSK